MLLILWPVLIVAAALALPDGWFSVAAIGVSAAVIAWHIRTYRPGAGHHRRPPAPEGVRIVHPDGTETPCELAYLGVVDGHHKWAVTNAHMSDGDELDCDRDTLAHNTFISVTTVDGLTGVAWGVVGYRMEGRA